MKTSIDPVVSRRPLGITIFAGIHYSIGVLALVTALLMLGVSYFAISVVVLVLGRGLFRGRKWAWVVSGISYTGFLVYSIVMLTHSVNYFFAVLIAFLIVLYIWFNKGVQAFFLRKTALHK